MLYKNRDWIEGIITFKDAHNNCIHRVKENVKLDSYLEWNDVKEFISQDVCLTVLENKKINNLVNKLTYQALEREIDYFTQIMISKKEELFKSCLQKQSFFKRENCIQKNWDKKASIVFDKWVSNKENILFKNYKRLFLNRSKDKKKVRRSIASE